MRAWLHLLRTRTLHYRLRPFSSTPHNLLTPPPPPAPLPPPASQDLFGHIHHLVFSEVGSLDDMESSLDSLGVPITASLVSSLITSASTTISVITTRRLLRFFSWSRRHCSERLSTDAFNHAIRAMAESKDFTALGILISDLRREDREMDIATFAAVSEALVKSGREVEAVRLFRHTENHHHRDQEDSRLASAARVMSIVQALCIKGHARKAEGVVWHHKHKISSSMEPDVYRHLLHGWCVKRNAGEARRVLAEMKEKGICPSIGSYNSFLRCVCDRNVKFNPSALVSEADEIMTEMNTSGVPPTTVSYNILLNCLGRVRRVKEACEVLEKMVQRNAKCFPDWVSYYLVIRVLYLTERFVRGNRIAGQMIDSGLLPDARFYHDLIGVLCGVERMDHALQMFEQMRKYCVEDMGPTYELLIGKLCRNGEFDMGKQLWDDAIEKGFVLHCSVDLLDPAKVKVFEVRKERDKPKAEDPKAREKKEQRGSFLKKAKFKHKKKAHLT